MVQFQTHPTPNPNSLKFTTDSGPFIEQGMESFASKDEARDHPLGKALFQHDGVINVFILPDFLTVTKDNSVDWDVLFPKVEATLRSHFETS